MSSADSKWGPACKPKRVAKAYYKCTKQSAAPLGLSRYLNAVAAGAYASMTNALSASTVLDGDLLAKYHNIYTTAHHVETLAIRGLDDSSDEEEAFDGKPPPVAALARTVVALRRQYEEQQQKLSRSANDKPAGPSHAIASSSAAASPADSGFPLPPAVLPALFSKLDARSAAAAAASCKELRAAYLEQSYYQLPLLIAKYIQAATDFAYPDIDEPDGSLESEFVVQHPLDGSTTCGADLVKPGVEREAALYYKHLSRLPSVPFPLPFPPGAKVHVPPPNSRPAPSPHSSPLAMFKDSTPVTLAGAPDLFPSANTPSTLSHQPTAATSPSPATASASASPSSAPTSAPGATASTPDTPGPSASSATSTTTPATSNSPSPATPNSTTAASDTGSPYTPATTTTSTTPSSTTTPAAAAAAAPPCSHDALTHACCDVRLLRSMCMGHVIHLDGDLLVIGYTHGSKDEEPGLEACVLSHGEGEDRTMDGIDYKEMYDSGFFDHVQEVCADAAHGLVWAAADDGRRIKAFRTPDAKQSSRGVYRNGSREGPTMALRHTLSSDVKGLVGRPAGLHVLEDSLVAVNGLGALMRWEVGRLPRQAKWRGSKIVAAAHKKYWGYADSEDEYDDDYYEDDEGQDGEGSEEEEEKEYQEPEFQCGIGIRGTEDSYKLKLEATPGVPPHVVHLLQLPVYDMGQRKRVKYIRQTALMADPASPAAPALVAALEGPYGNTVLTYDMETLRVRHKLLGHLYTVTDIAVPPPSWQTPGLFATASRTGDVKLWDVRSRGCSPCVTLVGGSALALEALALARAQGDAGQLGGGMMCFAGGAGEAVWAWDLRAGRAQALYELSTGNTHVMRLVWHQGSNSLLASTKSTYIKKYGGNNEDDWEGWSDQEDGGRDGGGNHQAWDAVPWWPRGARHTRRDFRAYFNEPELAVIQYRFSDGAERGVSRCDKPTFAYAYRPGRW